MVSDKAFSVMGQFPGDFQEGRFYPENQVIHFFGSEDFFYFRGKKLFKQHLSEFFKIFIGIGKNGTRGQIGYFYDFAVDVFIQAGIQDYFSRRNADGCGFMSIKPGPVFTGLYV
jgi:hypothetical protein